MHRLAKEVGINGRCCFKRYGGKLHVLFNGRPGLRQVLTGTRDGVQHAEVVSLGIGRAGVMKSVKGGSIVSVILLTAWNIVDFVMRDGATLGQLVGGITADITKAVIAGGVGYAGASVAVGLGMTVACGPLVLAVVVGVGVGWALDVIDKKYKLTEKMRNMLDMGFAELQRRKDALAAQGRRAVLGTIGDLVDLARDAAIGGVGREVQRRIGRFRWSPIPRLF